MDIMNFIIDNALALIPALYIIGLIIKAVPGIPDWLIPFILLACGVAGAAALLGFSAEAVLQGVLCTGAAVYVNQLIKQGTEGLKAKPPDAGRQEFIL